MSRVGGLLSRLGGSEADQPCEAVFARVLDGEHLWLAVRGDGVLRLRGDGLAIDVDAGPDPRDPSVRSAVVPVAAALARLAPAGRDDVVLALVAGEGRAETPVTWAGDESPSGPGDAAVPEPRTRDRRHQLSVEVVDGAVQVRRTARQRGVGVLGLTALDEGVALHLDRADGVLRVGPHTVGVVDGTAVLGALPDLPAGTTRLEVDGVPLLRTAHVVARPNAAVLLPPLPDVPGGAVELRWQREGRLAVHRRAADDGAGAAS
ncbi:hypothetical protein GCM10023340_36220 [Nocardioides marinquilinus]|uniref:Uncharacterized protein n=1 Tax=Nocardioides marinquilinus TaxID=1210400 RepID=A0ABP9PXS8_9ACTN